VCATRTNAAMLARNRTIGLQTRRVRAVATVLAVPAVIAACATITTGAFQTVSILTNPEGADCRFSRGGTMFARVSPTPGSIIVGKESGDISVLCTRDGYEDMLGTTASEFQPMTFGNIILGGIIGVVVDVSSGAMMKYPDAVTFTLVPQEFANAAERDRFFANLSSAFLVEYDETLARIKKACAAESCEQQIRAAEAGRTARLAEIEQKRQLARIRGA
jgi:hypothetical protein